jgi:hypothetical protein
MFGVASGWVTLDSTQSLIAHRFTIGPFIRLEISGGAHPR